MREISFTILIYKKRSMLVGAKDARYSKMLIDMHIVYYKFNEFNKLLVISSLEDFMVF